MEQAIESLNMIQMEKLLEDLMKYKMCKRDEEYVCQLNAAVDAYDADTCESILAEWKKRI